MFYMTNSDGYGYLEYSDKVVVTQRDVFYTRYRDVPRGLKRVAQAIASRDYALLAPNYNGKYHFSFTLKNGMILSSKKGYKSRNTAIQAYEKWIATFDPSIHKVKTINY